MHRGWRWHGGKRIRTRQAILVARLTARNTIQFFLLRRATTKPNYVKVNLAKRTKRNGRIEGQERTSGNMNAFKHGLVAIQKRREGGIAESTKERVGGRSPKVEETCLL